LLRLLPTLTPTYDYECYICYLDSDAPALSTEEPALSSKENTAAAVNPAVTAQAAAATPTHYAPPTTGPSGSTEDSQWQDSSTTATATTSAVNTTVAPAEAVVLDMKSLQTSKQANIAEKMRIEATKAALAAARQGMEREGQKLEAAKMEKAAKQQAPDAAAGSGGRWMPAHLRGGLASRMTASRLPGGGQKVDTSSAELFPDLQQADKILEQKERAQAASVKHVPKKTPVGGGANWASKAVTRPKLAVTPPKAAAKPEVVTPAVEAAAAEAVAPAPAPEPVVAAPVIKPSLATRKSATKKKKKDLSTFKPGGN
jgi:hypothetical protein